jgi:hypothetical protein
MTNQQWTVRHTATVLAGVVLIAALVAAVFGLHWLLRTSPDSWASAIVAVATVVLVAITACYSYLTFKLLEAQRSSARTSEQEHAMRDLNRFLIARTLTFLMVDRYFPVDATTTPTEPWDVHNNAITIFDKLKKAAIALVEFQGLLPEMFRDKVWHLKDSLIGAAEESLALARAATEEIRLSENETRSWTWAGAEALYADTKYADTEAWSDVLSGRKFRDALEACDELRRDLDAYLAN